MPKRKMPRSAAQKAASRRNLEKARAAKASRARYTGKSGLPHVGWKIEKNGPKGVVVRARTYNRSGDITGELYGQIDPVEVWSKRKIASSLSQRKGRTLDITDVTKLRKEVYGKSTTYSINDYTNGGKRSGAATLEPGISLLTAAARVAGSRSMVVSNAVPRAKSFYLLTGAKASRGANPFFRMTYSPAARKKLAGRRVVRVKYK